MEDFLVESGWALPETDTVVRVASRLISAVLLGAMVGLERERRGRAAGLRTHMMVALGSALFTLTPMEMGASASDVAQIVKGIATGIGFLGGGAILKLAAEREIKGLTTAAGIWLTAAIGMGAGAGKMWLCLIAALASVVILALLGPLEAYVNPDDAANHKSESHEPMPK
jgi:putative Mg2+ transporter-C (MgtC) family protein